MIDETEVLWFISDQGSLSHAVPRGDTCLSIYHIAVGNSSFGATLWGCCITLGNKISLRFNEVKGAIFGPLLPQWSLNRVSAGPRCSGKSRLHYVHPKMKQLQPPPPPPKKKKKKKKL